MDAALPRALVAACEMALFSAGQVIVLDTHTRMRGMQHQIPAAAKHSMTYCTVRLVVPMMTAKHTTDTAAEADRCHARSPV